MHPVVDLTRATIEQAVARATEGAMRDAPAGKWSAAGILEHLSLSYAGTAYAMRKAQEKGRPIGHPPTLGHRLAQLVSVKFGYFRRVDAPDATRPTGLAPSMALSAFRVTLGAMDEGITTCERRFGSAAFVADHPILGGLTADGWRRFHLQHARHHARQIVHRLSAGSRL